MDDNTANEMARPGSVLDAALSYMARGWWVFPAFVVWNEERRKKEPTFPGSWDAASSNDPAMAHAWFGPGGLYARRGHGVLCIDAGRSGLVVVDVDKGGHAGWAQFRALHRDCPETYRAATPGGGEHWFYAIRPGEPVTIDSSGKVAHEVDVRGQGGLVFAAPSVIDGYGTYRWLEGDPAGGSGDCPFVPRSVIAAMTAGAAASLVLPPGMGAAAPGAVTGMGRIAREFTAEQAWEFCRGKAEEFAGLAPGVDGQGRNQKLFELALMMAHFVGVFWDQDSVHAQLVKLAERNGMVAGHGLRAVEATIRSAWGRPRDWVAVVAPPFPVAGAVVAEPVAAGGELAPAAMDPVDALRAQFLDSEGLDGLEDPRPLVAGWLWRDTTGALIGTSGHGKSFSLIDISGAVGAGEPWHGIPTEQADVWWILGEGLHGARKRVRAWEQHHGRRLSGLRILPRPVQANGPAWEVLVALAGADRPGLIWLDTQARMTVGMEENSNTEMGAWVSAMDRLRRASGACVMAVHHTGYDASRGRGASALYGAWDTEIMASKADGPGGAKVVTLKSTKAKDDAEAEPMELLMTVVALDGLQDALGRPVTSVVLTQGAMSPIPGMGRVRPMGGRWDAMLEALPKSRLIIIDVLQNVFPAAGATKAEIRRECAVLGLAEARTFYRSWDDLVERGVLLQYEKAQRFNLASTFEGAGED